MKKTLWLVIVALAAITSLALVVGCGGSKTVFRLPLPNMVRFPDAIISSLTGFSSNTRLPDIMRFEFNGQLGWINFEERADGRVWASYRLEPNRGKMGVTGEGGTIEIPSSDDKAAFMDFGKMELRRSGRELVGHIKDDDDPSRNGEVEIKFSKGLGSFTGRFRDKDNRSWQDALTGTSR